jgi:hypothetical protein
MNFLNEANGNKSILDNELRHIIHKLDMHRYFHLSTDGVAYGKALLFKVIHWISSMYYIAL